MNPLGVEIDDLTLRYSDTTALDRLRLTLAPGRIYGLLGRNGSGKTSLLSLLAAFRRPTAGTVRVGGEDPFENERITRQVCLIRDGSELLESERCDRNLALARTLRPYWDQQYAEQLADRFGLPLRRPALGLSRGQRAALACVIGLASRAPLTMFDEAYLGLDAPSRYAFYQELLADYAAHPRTIILSTHLIEEFAGMFEEVVIIDRGRLLVHAEADELRARGATVTGPAEAVDRFVTGLTVLHRRQLGGTASATVYGPVPEQQRRHAADHGLHLEPVPLQDLFVHLTAEQSGGGAAAAAGAGKVGAR